LLLGAGKASSREREKVLHVQDDFDMVILALGPDELDALSVTNEAGKNVRADLPRPWKLRQGARNTVATHAAQVWLTRDLEELGWYRGPGIMSALGLPFDTWADMTHTLSSERAWRRAQRRTRVEADTARSVAYFCGVVSDAQVKKGRAHLEASLRRSLEELLADKIRHLWPSAFTGGRNASSLVVGSHERSNTVGSDRYSLSLPGSIRDRVSPLDRGVLNLTVAGDWTACGLDAGCVEAAVMSGMLAAHAIDGEQPALESIVGYDHP
jgi:hypothetical protein